MESVYTPAELRVLGCLMEKEMATPEYYPLTLNALVMACNQKTNRNPVVSYDEDTVISALSRLKEKRVVWRSEQGRVPRYEQFFTKNNNLLQGEAALMCMLMLRGPQTAGELKQHAERLQVFDDLKSLTATLEDLIEHGLVARLARQPGQKEVRYAQLLGVFPEDAKQSRSEPAGDSPGTQARLAAIETEVADLRCEIEGLRRTLNAHLEQTPGRTGPR